MKNQTILCALNVIQHVLVVMAPINQIVLPVMNLLIESLNWLPNNVFAKTDTMNRLMATLSARNVISLALLVMEIHRTIVFPVMKSKIIESF